MYRGSRLSGRELIALADCHLNKETLFSVDYKGTSAMGVEVLFYFFIVSHACAFALGMWLAIVANGKRAQDKGVCACHPGDDVYVYTMVREGSR